MSDLETEKPYDFEQTSEGLRHAKRFSVHVVRQGLIIGNPGNSFFLRYLGRAEGSMQMEVRPMLEDQLLEDIFIEVMRESREYKFTRRFPPKLVFLIGLKEGTRRNRRDWVFSVATDKRIIRAGKLGINIT